MFYRTIRMIDNGIKPIFVFDGKAPTLKTGEVRNAPIITGTKSLPLIVQNFFEFWRDLANPFTVGQAYQETRRSYRRVNGG